MRHNSASRLISVSITLLLTTFGLSALAAPPAGVPAGGIPKQLQQEKAAREAADAELQNEIAAEAAARAAADAASQSNVDAEAAARAAADTALQTNIDAEAAARAAGDATLQSNIDAEGAARAAADTALQGNLDAEAAARAAADASLGSALFARAPRAWAEVLAFQGAPPVVIHSSPFAVVQDADNNPNIWLVNLGEPTNDRMKLCFVKGPGHCIADDTSEAYADGYIYVFTFDSDGDPAPFSIFQVVIF